MASTDIDAVLVTKRVNYMHLSGLPVLRPYFYKRERAVLLTDFRYVEQAAMQAPDYEIIRYVSDQFGEINKLLESERIKRLAFEDCHLSYKLYMEYSEKLKTDGFVPLGGMIEGLRCIKDQTEIGLIRKAVDIADEVFTISWFHKAGTTELDIADEIEHYMKRLGAEGPSFETIVASGKRASDPRGGIRRSWSTGMS